MKLIRLLLLTLFLVMNSAFCNTFSTDMSDLWWNANEPGWGVTATHQGDVVFLTFFVYDSSNKPKWYTATASYVGSTNGELFFTGPMHETSGPWFGTLFNSNAVTVKEVGTATFSAFAYSATLTYRIDGVVISKALSRQTFRANNLTGEYSGLMRTNAVGCVSGVRGGISEETLPVSIVVSDKSFSMSTISGDAIVCEYVGDYTQAGRLGRAKGTLRCRALRGTFEFEEIEANPGSLSLVIKKSHENCSQITGRLVALRR